MPVDNRTQDDVYEPETDYGEYEDDGMISQDRRETKKPTKPLVTSDAAVYVEEAFNEVLYSVEKF